jgi:tRNA U34 5-carboxymethylaminomethyl modifying enzyme MnmG/GidA
MKIAKTVREILTKRFGAKAVEAPPTETVKKEILETKKEITEAVKIERIGILAEKKAHRYTAAALQTKARYDAYLKREKKEVARLQALIPKKPQDVDRLAHHEAEVARVTKILMEQFDCYKAPEPGPEKIVCFPPPSGEQEGR